MPYSLRLLFDINTMDSAVTLYSLELLIGINIADATEVLYSLK